MPKVSVIVPVYGVEKYIERCARSLFEQTLDDIEYLFIDDCTPDRSIKILQQVLEEYPQRMPQVVIHRMEKNSGQAAVRKWGMKHAKGEYIIHCDSDDWIDVTAYENMYKKANEENADVVICDLFYSDGMQNKRITGCHNIDKDALFKNILLQKDHGSLCNKMINKVSCLNKIVWPKGDMGEDMLMCMQIVYNAKKIAYIPEAYYYYYMNPSSITSSNSKEAIIHRFTQSIKNTDSLLFFFKSNGVCEKYKYTIERMLFNKKNLIRPLIKEKKYYKQWKNTYSELNYKILLNPELSIGMKLKHVMALIHMYS